MPKMERLYLFIYLRWNVFKWASKASRILIYGKERVFTSVVDPEEPIAPYWLAPWRIHLCLVNHVGGTTVLMVPVEGLSLLMQHGWHGWISLGSRSETIPLLWAADSEWDKLWLLTQTLWADLPNFSSRPELPLFYVYSYFAFVRFDFSCSFTCLSDLKDGALILYISWCCPIPWTYGILS